MAQAEFLHGTAIAVCDVAESPVANAQSASIYADRAHLRDTLREDVVSAGFRLGRVGAIPDLLACDPVPLGEVVLVDCPVPSGIVLAALSRLDLLAAKGGACLIVSTTLDALDGVFACLDQSNLQILITPTRSERVIALGLILAKMPGMRLRELNQEDRLTLLRLTEQVGQIAERLERLSGAEVASGKGADGGAFRFESPSSEFGGRDEENPSDRLVRAARPPLPDPRLVRQIIRQRQLRARYFDDDLFADPAWDILLDLTAARAEHTRVSVTSLCIASGAPPTTALRWISQMVKAGLLKRVEDEADKRRAFITLTDKAADAMARYFEEMGKDAARAV